MIELLYVGVRTSREGNIQDRAQICAVQQSTAPGSEPDVVVSVPWIPYVN